jgi:hypothetical protein
VSGSRASSTRRSYDGGTTPTGCASTAGER